MHTERCWNYGGRARKRWCFATKKERTRGAIAYNLIQNPTEPRREVCMEAVIVHPENVDEFQLTNLAAPTPQAHDLLVEVKAISLNPVDTKVRKGRKGRVLGWDASGVVVGIGDKVTGYRVGDEVYYAGDITRDGSAAALQLVDERIVGRKPRKLDHLQAASVPLTALTAWEGLYEQLAAIEGKSILIIGAAGGVGSIAVQMAKKLLKMNVIGTASRDETIAWVKRMGADHVISHREPLAPQLKAIGCEFVDHIFCCQATDSYFDAMAEVIAPQGRIVSIVEPHAPLDMGKLFRKKVRFAWELMFTKAIFKTADLESQRTILNRVADLIDEGVLEHTLTVDGGELGPQTLNEAHRKQTSGTMIGKLGLRVALSR